MLFLLYVIVSCIFLFDKNPYQHHVYMTSAGALAANVYELSNSVTSYFNLRDINEELQIQNARLEAELIAMREQLNNYGEMHYGDTMSVPKPLMGCDFIISHVVNNSVHHPKNYITIDKGRRDSIRPEMGVVDQNGVVGIVNLVSDNYARVISVLNSNFSLSCKVKGNDAFGSLVWDGKRYDEALLKELPRHSEYHEGDTIVTSGFSSVFPEGILVGTVIGKEKDVDVNFYTLRIKLLTDFTTLSTVRIISNSNIEEIRTLEASTKPYE